MYFPQTWLSIGRLDVLLAKTLGSSHGMHNCISLAIYNLVWKNFCVTIKQVLLRYLQPE